MELEIQNKLLTVQEITEDYQDLRLLREAKKERVNDPLISFEDMKKEFIVYKSNPTDFNLPR
jgi:hypothetical protein